MRYFAGENAVTTADMSSDPAWIEISAEQHERGMNALLDGLEVTIDGGFTVRDPKPSAAHDWVDGAWVDTTPVELASVGSDMVNAERDRRINAGFTFGGVVYQSDKASRDRIDRARLSAVTAILAGAQPGDLRWHGLPVDFVWIAADDTHVEMDAQTVVAFGNASAARDGIHIIAANDLKQMDPIPADFADDQYWPQA